MLPKFCVSQQGSHARMLFTSCTSMLCVLSSRVLRYTGHIPAQPAASDQPVNTRDLDKSRSLIVQNYKPFPG